MLFLGVRSNASDRTGLFLLDFFLDISDGISNSHDIVTGVIVRYLNSELLFKIHHQFNDIE